MVDTSAPILREDPANYHNEIVEDLWTEFQHKNDVSNKLTLDTYYLITYFKQGKATHHHRDGSLSLLFKERVSYSRWDSNPCHVLFL